MKTCLTIAAAALFVSGAAFAKKAETVECAPGARLELVSAGRTFKVARQGDVWIPCAGPCGTGEVHGIGQEALTGTIDGRPFFMSVDLNPGSTNTWESGEGAEPPAHLSRALRWRSPDRRLTGSVPVMMGPLAGRWEPVCR